MASTSNKSQPSVVHTIECRVEQLIADHRRISDLNRDLMQQCNDLQAAKRELQEQVTKLEKELAMSDLKAGLSGATKSNARARAYVNRLMREVDSCITLLSSAGVE